MSSEPLPLFDHTKPWVMTESPNPNFKFGQKVDATPEGREWLKKLESGFVTVDTSKTSDAALIYKIMIAGIAPRPIAFVSTVSEDGVENLGLFSWFNQVSPNPPVISISCLNRDIRVKDTVRNIRATKGFTVNTISEVFVDNANACSIDAPPEISEWPLSGLTKEPSIHVKAPRVKESAFSMECELLQTVDIIEPNSLKATTTLVLGTVKLIHMRRDTLDPVRGLPDPGKLKPVVRLGGMTYARLGDGFQVPRPAWENMKDEIRETLGEVVVTGRNN